MFQNHNSYPPPGLSIYADPWIFVIYFNGCVLDKNTIFPKVSSSLPVSHLYSTVSIGLTYTNHELENKL